MSSEHRVADVSGHDGLVAVIASLLDAMSTHRDPRRALLDVVSGQWVGADAIDIQILIVSHEAPQVVSEVVGSAATDVAARLLGVPIHDVLELTQTIGVGAVSLRSSMPLQMHAAAHGAQWWAVARVHDGPDLIGVVQMVGPGQPPPRLAAMMSAFGAVVAPAITAAYGMQRTHEQQPASPSLMTLAIDLSDQQIAYFDGTSTLAHLNRAALAAEAVGDLGFRVVQDRLAEIQLDASDVDFCARALAHALTHTATGPAVFSRVSSRFDSPVAHTYRLASVRSDDDRHGVLIVADVLDAAAVPMALPVGCCSVGGEPTSSSLPFPLENLVGMIERLDSLVSSVASTVGAQGLVERAAPVAGAVRDASDETIVRSLDQLGLAPRQREIVVMLMTGSRVAQIARRLCISTNTVRAHLRAVFAKAGVSSQAELIELLRTPARAAG